MSIDCEVVDRNGFGAKIDNDGVADETEGFSLVEVVEIRGIDVELFKLFSIVGEIFDGENVKIGE